MTDGKFKHTQKGITMDRTTKDIAALVPPKIMEHYKYVHLDLDVLSVNGVVFLLEMSRDIGFICFTVYDTQTDAFSRPYIEVRTSTVQVITT